MDLGMAMVGGNAFFREQQAEELRNRERARFDWETRRANAEMGLLDAKSDAERTGYELKSGQNRAGSELLPGDTANKKTEQQLRTGELTGQVNRQPVVEETKDITTGMALEDAKSDQLMNPDKNATERNNAAVAAKDSEFNRDNQGDVLQQKQNVIKIAKDLSDYELEDLPRKLSQMRLANEISQADSEIMVAAKISDLITANDANSLIRLLNAQKRSMQDPKVQSMPDVASVAKGVDNKGVEVLILKDAQGKQITARPIAFYNNAKNSLAKITYEKVDAGDTLYRVQGGSATAVATAPESQKSTMAKTPVLQQNLDMLQSRYGMTEQEALNYMNSSKTMSKQEWVNRALLEKSKLETPTQKDIDELSKVWDSVNAASQRKSSNTTQKSTMGKKEVRSVLGLD